MFFGQKREQSRFFCFLRECGGRVDDPLLAGCVKPEERLPLIDLLPPSLLLFTAQ